MAEAESEHPEPRKLHGAAATAAAKKASSEGSALAKFLSAIDDGFEAAYAEATADVEAAQQTLTDARAKMQKLEAFKAVRDGKVPTDLLGEPVRRRAPATSRAAKGEASGKVLEMLKGAGPDGLNRAELIDRMGVKGNKSGEASISNALASLKKAGDISHNADGRYSVPA